MAYNLTALQNSNTVSDLFIYANTITDNILSVLFLLSVFFITLFWISSKEKDISNALLPSSYITFITAILLKALGTIQFNLVFAFLILIAITVTIKLFQK